MPLIRKFSNAEAGALEIAWNFSASTGHLWHAMTDRETLPLWLGKYVAGNLKAGSNIEIEHAKDYICKSRIEKVQPGSALLMSWKFPDEDDSSLSLALRPRSIGSELVLSHTKLSVDVSGYLAGWETHLLYLEAVLVGAPRSMDQFWDLYRDVSAS